MLIATILAPVILALGSGAYAQPSAVFRKAAVQLSQKGAAMDWFALRPMTGQSGAVALARYAPNCVVLFYDFMIGEAQAMLSARQFIVSSRKIELPIDRSALTSPALRRQALAAGLRCDLPCEMRRLGGVSPNPLWDIRI